MLKSVSYRWTRTGTQIRKCVERKLFLPRSPRKTKNKNNKKLPDLDAVIIFSLGSSRSNDVQPSGIHKNIIDTQPATTSPAPEVEFQGSPSKASSSYPQNPFRSPLPWLWEQPTRLINEASNELNDMHAR